MLAPIYTDPLDNLEETTRQHWAKYLPKMTAELAAQPGELEKAIQNAAKFTREEVERLESQGLNRLQAWELTREQWVILPPEPEEPPTKPKRQRQPKASSMT